MHVTTTPNHLLPSLAALLALTAVLSAQDPGDSSYARPIDRRFGFVEETLHGAPPGHFEFEQWATLMGHAEADHDFRRADFKEELEYGLAENLHLAIDFAEWHYEDSAAEKATRFDATGVELKLRLLDPRRDVVGLGIKTELEFGPKDFEWKNTLIVDKTIDRWHVAYNFLLVAGWEGEKTFEYSESDGEIQQSFGASLELGPTTYVGAELVWGIPLPEWKSGGDQDVYLGPNFAYHGHDWAVTATPVFLLTGGDDAPDFQLRLLFEVDF